MGIGIGVGREYYLTFLVNIFSFFRILNTIFIYILSKLSREKSFVLTKKQKNTI